MVRNGNTSDGAPTPSFAEFLGELSTGLLKANPSVVDTEIKHYITRIGERYNVDRVALRKFDEDLAIATALQSWVSSNEIGLATELRVEPIPWVASKLFRNEIARINRLADLPPEASPEREILENGGLQALLAVPIRFEEELYGVIDLASRAERAWTDETANELKLLGAALVCAHARAKNIVSLEANESRYRAVVENQTEFIVRWLPDGTRTWVNDRYCEFFQTPRKKLIGTSFLPLVLQADKQKVMDKVAAMSPDNPTQAGEHQVLLPNGEVGWQSWVDTGIFDESGKLREIQSVGRDITEQKRIEEAVSESEARYRELVENSTDSIWELSLDLEYSYVNDRLASLLGYTPDELQKLSLKQLLHPEDWSMLEEYLPGLIEDRSGWRKNIARVRHKDGTYRYLESNANPVFDAEGNLCGYRGVDRDITEEVLYKDAIRKSEDLYRTLFESANDAIFYMDDEIVVDCNKKTLEMLHCEAHEVIGKKPWHFSPEFQYEGLTSKETGQAILKAIESGEPQCFEWAHSQPDGAVLDTEVSLTPVELADGSPRLLAIARDITERNRARREIEHQAKFQGLLADLSTEIATAPVAESDELFDQVFARIGDWYGLSSIAIGWYSEDDKRQTLGLKAGWRWVKGKYPRAIGRVARADLPWFMSRMFAGEALRIDDIDELPAEASTDQATLKKLGAPALLGFPVLIREAVAGVCVMISPEPRAWSAGEFEELSLVANAVSGAVVRAWAIDGMMRRERDLARSQTAARVGSYSMRYAEPQSEFSMEGRVEMSEEFCKLFGLESRNDSTATVLSRIPPGDAERVVRGINNAFVSGNEKIDTHRVVRPDGSTIYVNGWVEVDSDEQGRARRLFGTALDVTEQVEAKNRIQNALDEIEELKNQLQEENIYLRKEISTTHNFGKIIGSSAGLKQALAAVEKVAPTDIPVLILGETGTGKELVARAVHDLSERKDKALITVNCAVLSKDLIASELFGHEKGAFTGADSMRKGRFELADGGTLFLDEIGELPGELQAKLLRVLQAGEFERLGGSKTLKVNVRLITATNRNLSQAVDEGRFRADLYYRISTFPIEMPALRERREDIPDLTEFFVQKHAKQMGKEITSISAAMIRHLKSREWPGNVRELEGFIQRALISTTGPTLNYSGEHGDVSESEDTAETTTLEDAQRQHIVNMLEKTGWVIDGNNGAAALMGVAPSTLRSKMKRLGIERPD